MENCVFNIALCLFFVLALCVCVNEVFNYFKEINDHE